MGPAPSYSSYTDSIYIYVSFQKGGTYLDSLYHILYISGWLDLVLVFFEPADHLERFQDVNDIVNSATARAQLLNAVINVDQLDLRVFCAKML